MKKITKEEEIMQLVDASLDTYYPDSQEGQFFGDVDSLVGAIEDIIADEDSAKKKINEMIRTGLLIEDTEEMVNPENSQRTNYIEIITTSSFRNSVSGTEARKQITLTSQYHDWHNTVADDIAEDVTNREKITKEKMEKYNNYLHQYDNHDCTEPLSDSDNSETILNKLSKNNPR